jgi:enterochelin esterase family protein
MSILILIATVLLLPPARAWGATFNVDSTLDVADAIIGDGACATAAGVCTLRAAVQEAGAFPDADVIMLGAETYTLTIPGRDEELGATGDLDLRGQITITGQGLRTTIIDGNQIDRVFDAVFDKASTNARLSLTDLTVQNGHAGLGVGGGIHVRRVLGISLTLTRAAVRLSAPDGIWIAEMAPAAGHPPERWCQPVTDHSKNRSPFPGVVLGCNRFQQPGSEARMRQLTRTFLTIAAAAIVAIPAEVAGQGRGGRGGSPIPQFVSPEVGTDRRITFRIYAPQADAVRLAAGDIPGVGQNGQLTRGQNGVWELTCGPVDPGTYRYNLNVDGVATIDPRNPSVSESNNNVWSLVHVPGADLFDTRDVPRGAVAEVTYKSTALGQFRRMHVYTPPGYETGRDRYPVFYLLHGAGDSDDSWSTVGRAGFILDNLIATRKARPMIVVMPAGHAARTTDSAIGQTATEQFVSDFVTDLMPYIEKNYRVLTDRANTAIAGLSMGGNQTLEVAVPRLQRFAYIGVFSSGLFGAFPGGGRGAAATPAPTGGAPPAAVEWEKVHAAKLDDAALKRGLRLLWFGTGKDDFLIQTTVATVDLFKRHGFAPVFVESPGGHTWINWRNYLVEFAPQLFKN